jgi:hypothetical protein
MIPPPPPRRAGSNGAPPPPPPLPPQNLASGTQTSFSTSLPTAPTAYSAAAPKSYEPYGEIQTISSSTSGIAHRRTNETQPQVPSATFTYGGGPSSSYAVPPSSYGKPHPTPSPLYQERRSSAAAAEMQQYQHNSSSLLFLIPSLASILWWHESFVVIQIFLFVSLVLYGLDLINARDALAVGIWVSALVLTMASGFGTLLQVDDADATGGAMILFLLRLSVEGMLFCSIVSTLRYRWFMSDHLEESFLRYLVSYRRAGVHFNSVGCTKKSLRLQVAWKNLCIHCFRRYRHP